MASKTIFCFKVPFPRPNPVNVVFVNSKTHTTSILTVSIGSRGAIKFGPLSDEINNYRPTH